ncbi:ComF family protein [Candidatus Uhrbacteria bacterium]|jgi:ComF family protein|nr:ComF family protein [Candidatus Uhrbacteria bacterium]
MRSFFVRAVFPRFCVGCRVEGSLLCGDCRSDWLDVPIHLSGKRHVFSFLYADPIARSLMCAWKYSYDWSAWDLLKEKMEIAIPVLSSFVGAAGIDVVTYVPLHRVKKNRRGFDQAKEIAQWLAVKLDLEMRSILVRAKYTKAQARQSNIQRKRSLKDSPFMSRNQRKEEKVLLIDDVWTTGSTMYAASKVIYKGGASRVWYYTLAKG